MLINFQNPLLRQYVVVIAVNLNVLATGVGLVWPSPVLVKLSNDTQTVLPRPITEEEGSWIVSIGTLTGIAANIFLGTLLVDQIGRRYCLILFCLPKFVAAFVFIYASEVWMLLLGRALFGIADSGVFTLLPMYASEVASKEIRGSLGSILQIMCSFGVVIMFSMGPFVSYTTLNVIFTGIVIFSTIPLFIIPDSPYSLYSKGHKSEALRVLTFLRGSETLANEELKEYEIASEKSSERISKKDILTNRLFLKSMVLVLVMSLGAQLVGFNAISFYLQTVLDSTQTSVRSEVASVIIGLIQLFASFCTMMVTDKFGRKPILAITCIGMGLGMLGLGSFFKVKENGAVEGFMNYLPLISLILVVFCFSSGLGSLCWVINAELFDDQSRGIGMSISLVCSSISMFLTTKYFALVTSVIGPAITYWIFCVNCILLCLFIIFCVPETKGKSFAEIQNILRMKKEDKSTRC